MQTNVFLGTTACGPTGLTLSQSSAINLNTDVPAFVEHNMGAMPTGTTIKYSEGVAVE